MEHRKITLDAYVLDGLMADLVGHDRRPSAFILYLALLRLTLESRRVAMSLQGLACATGLSKTAVQRAVGHLVRRQLVITHRLAPTDVPQYEVMPPRPVRRA